MKYEKHINILIVEYDTALNRVLNACVRNACNSLMYPNIDFEIKSYFTAQECMESDEIDVDVLILDFYLKEDDEPEITDGYDLLKEVKSHNPNCLVIISSALEDARIATHLTKLGIYEYINKNIPSINRLDQASGFIGNNQVLKN